MKKLSVLVDGQMIEGDVQVHAGVLWAHVDGATLMLPVEDLLPNRRSARRGKARADADPSQVLAPMPGKIVKIMSAKGAAVEPGTVLLVMEAMKMEYTLKAQAAGKLGDVQCAVGDQVALGQVLMKLEIK